MATKYLDGLIRDIAGELKRGTVPLQGITADELNEELDAINDVAILYTLIQSGVLEVTSQRYGYLEYNTRIWFASPVPDDTTESIEQAVHAMMQLAFEFFAELTKQNIWRTHPANNAEPLRPSFTTIADAYDTMLAGVFCDLTIRINPGFDRTNICA